jgi:mRNA interferase RelE/StbE
MDIRYTPTARGQLVDLDRVVQVRIAKKMQFFGKQKDPLSFAKHLAGYDMYRFRVGDYRIICEVYEGNLEILYIGKRDNVYKNL